MTNPVKYNRTTTSSQKFRPNFTNIIFFSLVHIIGLLSWPIYLYLGGGIQWQEIAIFFFMFALGVIGINVGYHRALSHLSLKMSPFMKFLALFGGASVSEGSAMVWCSDHRRHHKFQDTDRDPYNINRGFWWAHMGWLLGTETTTDFSNVPDLNRDPLIQHQHKYYAFWLAGACFLFPLALGFLLGRPVAGFLLGGFMRVFLFNHFTFLINSYAHYFGRRPYSLNLTARDSLICSILAHGEGWHNFHHKFPFDYRNGHRFYHYDPAKWFIILGRSLGWTQNLKQTPAQEIYRAKIQTQRVKLNVQHSHHQSINDALDQALVRWTALGLEWERFKVDMEKRGSDQMKILRKNLKEAHREFKARYSHWKQSLKEAESFAS